MELGQYEFMTTDERQVANDFCLWFAGMDMPQCMATPDRSFVAVAAWLLATAETALEREHADRHAMHVIASYVEHGVAHAEQFANRDERGNCD